MNKNVKFVAQKLTNKNNNNKMRYDDMRYKGVFFKDNNDKNNVETVVLITAQKENILAPSTNKKGVKC